MIEIIQIHTKHNQTTLSLFPYKKYYFNKSDIYQYTINHYNKSHTILGA